MCSKESKRSVIRGQEGNTEEVAEFHNPEYLNRLLSSHLQQQERLLLGPFPGDGDSFTLRTGNKSFTYSLQHERQERFCHGIFNRADLGVFLVVEVGAKAEVLQVDGLVFAFVCEVGHLLWRGDLQG